MRRASVHAITSRDIPLPRVATSMLPDGAEYPDTGCEFASSCLACPFARCKFDDPEVFKLESVRRDREIALLRTKYHAPIEALMHAYGLSRTQVYRALREYGALRPWVDRDGQSRRMRYGAKRRATPERAHASQT